MSYLGATSDYKLIGVIKDPASDLYLVVYVDANFCGDTDNTRSTSGAWLTKWNMCAVMPSGTTTDSNKPLNNRSGSRQSSTRPLQRSHTNVGPMVPDPRTTS